MQLKERILYKLREIYYSTNGLSKGLIKSIEKVNTSVEDYNKNLSEAIKNQIPFMVSRFGSEELKWYLNIQSSKESILKRYRNFVTGRAEYFDRRSLSIIDNMTVLPRKSLEASEQFYNKYHQSLKSIDILGTWIYNERYVDFKEATKFIELFNLEPYKYEIPWTLSLEAKKVLVIHPMVELIESQWIKREKLFNPSIWPKNVELKLLKAKYFDDPIFNTWQKIMDYYTLEVEKIEFDVAIIGNSSWGLPLAAHIKEMGKVAINIGGATQLIFGIYGKRWLNWKEYTCMINSYWVSGSLSEQKLWMDSYDNASYW